MTTDSENITPAYCESNPIILVIPEQPDRPKEMAGRYKWTWALQLVEFYPKGKHYSTHFKLLQVRHNTPTGALAAALRLELERIKVGN